MKIADTGMVCRKLVIIGDGACGKTSLLSVFTLGYFPTVSVSMPLYMQFKKLTDHPTVSIMLVPNSPTETVVVFDMDVRKPSNLTFVA